MKKDIEWLKKEVEKQDVVMDKGYIYTSDLIYLIDSLDEPEVLSQDLPVVPTWFDEWWKDIPKGGGNLFHNIGRFQDELFSFETIEAYDYISGPDNKKKLLNIIINELDYVVEDEQKYFVSSRESVGFWFLSKNNDNEVVIGTNKDYYDRKWESLKLTEEEIDYIREKIK